MAEFAGGDQAPDRGRRAAEVRIPVSQSGLAMRWIDETFHPAQHSTRRDGGGVLQGRQEDEADATEGTKLQGGLHLSVNERCLGPHRADGD